MNEFDINKLIFYTPAVALKRLEGNSGKGIYFIALKKESTNAFQAINPVLHEDLISRKECALSNGDILIYIGKANGQDGLRQRLSQDLKQRGGPSTFFRSVGAVLMKNPYKGQAKPSNYLFKDPEKQSIIDFLENNFVVACKPISETSSIDLKERELIMQYSSIFNIINNSHKNSEVKKQRKRCRDIASQPKESI